MQRLWSCRSTRHASTFCLKSIFPLGLGQQFKANCSGWVQTSTQWLSRVVSNTFPWQPCQYWSMFPHFGSGLNTLNVLCKMEAQIQNGIHSLRLLDPTVSWHKWYSSSCLEWQALHWSPCSGENTVKLDREVDNKKRLEAWNDFHMNREWKGWDHLEGNEKVYGRSIQAS